MKKNLLLLALLAPLAAYAVDSSKDEYIGGHLSLSRHSVTLPGYKSSNVDNNSNGYGLRAGFYSRDNLSWELDYQDYGKSKRMLSNGVDSDRVESKLSSVGISAIGHLPLNDKLGLYGRAGMARVESKTTGSDGSGFKAHKTVPVIGLGVETQLQPDMRAFVEVAKTGKVKSSTGSQEDTHSGTRLSGGITYHY